jgi:hypothetical protein
MDASVGQASAMEPECEPEPELGRPPPASAMAAQSALLAAIKAGDEAGAVDALDKQGASLTDVLTSGGSHALHKAAFDGKVQLCELFLRRRANINLAREDGSTPLILASHNGHAAAVGALLGAGAAVDQPNQNGSTPLFVASEHGHAAAVEALLGGGAAFDQPTKNGFTPLHIASQKGHVVVVEALLGAGANPALINVRGNTAAQVALHANFPMIVALCDPTLAHREGQKLKDAFKAAPLAHVLSTRFRRPRAAPEGWSDERQGSWADSCDPNASAAALKFVLEARSTAKVFNPNYDNAFLMAGNSEDANAVWLKNWREVGLEAAKHTGGACVQLVTPPGLSPMQEAEASMAKDKGVRIVRVDCTGMKYAATEPKLMRLPAFAELVGAGGAALPPLSRDRLLELALGKGKPTDDERARLEAESQRAAPEGVPPMQPLGSGGAAAAPESRFTQRAGYLGGGHPMCKSEPGHTLASAKARCAELGAAGFSFEGSLGQQPPWWIPTSCHFSAVVHFVASAAHTAFVLEY